MDISALLKAVILNIKAKDHETVLNEMTRRLLPEGTPAEEKAFCDLRDHESVEGMLTGTDSAIFHCLSEEVKDTSIALAISRRELPHPAKKIKVRLFFLIISPLKESGTHLQLLSKIEGMLLDRALHHAIMNARSEPEVRDVIKRAETSARSLYIPLPREEVFGELGSQPVGLTEAAAGERLKLTGPNSIKRIEKGTLLKDFLYNMFLNLFAVLLWAGGFMSFVAGMPELGWAIFLVIVINASFSFWQEYKAERAVEALKNLLPKKVRVIRDGREREIDAALLVPGDLIKLAEGDSIPADGRLVEAEAMRIDNSALTGESRPIYKVSEPLADGKGFIWTEVPNMVFAGTTVLSGSGNVVVTATGMDTEIGRVAYLTQAIKPEMSPLQKEIKNITKVVTMIAVTLGVLFFFLGYSFAGLTFAESFIFAIGIIVANVPEGLLPTVSLSLAMGVQRMASKNAIVKKLSAVETLGSATVICTDKTGTLTRNQMCVTRLFVNNKMIEVTGTGYEPDGAFVHDGKKLSKEELASEGIRKLLLTGALCNNAKLSPPSKDSRLWSISGDPTEGALLTAAAKGGIDMDSLNKEITRVAHLPFERIRKMMTTVHEGGPDYPKGGRKAAAFIKGAPKEVLSLCTSVFINGATALLTDREREEILKENDLLASKGLRILAFASREMERRGSYATGEVERELTFIGLMAMLDPPRPEVKRAVSQCHTAGIKVVMVTGDYGLTAKAIAGQVGIAQDARVITGEELGRFSKHELQEILKKGEVIFARVAPADKLKVVEALQKNGEIVAVTGDGVNDAPALKKADIGVAMGLRGSDAAKESAEMVLADDNFASIVDAIKEGRAVYANIKKFVTYIFASNIPEIVPFIAFVIFKIPLPLTVMQILAVDLGTDVFPALGLGVEPPEEGVMNQPPRPRGKRLLDFKTLSRAYLFLGPLEAALALSGFFFAYWLRGWSPGTGMEEAGMLYATATTMSFAGIVASQVGNVFACRTEKESVFKAGFFKNRFVLISIAVEISLMLILIYTPVLQDVFGFAPLSLYEWGYLAVFPVIMLAADETRKAMLRRGAIRA
ncbi:MAG: HAD-IC family P-type ATPase [Deltaproteobacteria bacterium]|nr:HAD-IC family P-type ATPase [Deltaproteobacteria bacterium]